jgi:hypothetical protein
VGQRERASCDRKQKFETAWTHGMAEPAAFVHAAIVALRLTVSLTWRKPAVTPALVAIAGGGFEHLGTGCRLGATPREFLTPVSPFPWRESGSGLKQSRCIRSRFNVHATPS